MYIETQKMTYFRVSIAPEWWDLSIGENTIAIELIFFYSVKNHLKIQKADFALCKTCLFNRSKVYK
ncbi:hypothetical protein M23134_04254 [Microscilla marina ATCC 23134]|uniref:Uncharacterized protein n=1 Tax=Microscilla marina ATCC 23134 TaxID=313606 RepID=A1ZEB3_MICM2|nr:hypothetical protein M23134_04254 [Microscilla marina ATCC 23134]